VGILISLFQSLVSIADAIVYGVLYFFAIILITIAFATADGDDYWAEGGMPLSTESSVD
jgi:type III secretory pathway component EscS